MIIVGLSNSKKLARKIAQKLNLDYEDLNVRDSYDGEIHVRFKNKLENQKVVLVQSLYPHPNYSLFEVLFSASVLRDLGAKEVIYVAPYLAYLREDNRKEKGECVSSKVLGDLLSRNVDCVISVEPHFHQYSEIKKLFSIPLYKLDCNELLRSYVAKNFKGCEVIGVGEKAKVLVKHVSSDSKVFEKGKVNFEGERVMAIDDMVSSGKSMMQTLDRIKAHKIYLMTVHGLFVGDAYERLKERVDGIVSSNTLTHESNEIDVSDLIARRLMEL